jgi:hypothetical protein
MMATPHGLSGLSLRQSGQGSTFADIIIARQLLLLAGPRSVLLTLSQTTPDKTDPIQGGPGSALGTEERRVKSAFGLKKIARPDCATVRPFVHFGRLQQIHPGGNLNNMSSGIRSWLDVSQRSSPDSVFKTMWFGNAAAISCPGTSTNRGQSGRKLTGTLDKELETYPEKLPSLLLHEGKFVLTGGGDIARTSDTKHRGVGRRLKAIQV